MGITAYKQTITETETPRQIERRVLANVTAEIEKFQSDFDSADRRRDMLKILAGGLRPALWKNQQIWITLKSDLAEPGNALGNSLRAGLISLALWVERHTVEVLEGTAQVRPLVDINRSIIHGLEGTQNEAGK